MRKRFIFDPPDHWNPWTVKSVRQSLRNFFWIIPSAILVFQLLILLMLSTLKEFKSEPVSFVGTAALWFCFLGSLLYSMPYFTHTAKQLRLGGRGRPLQDFLNYVPLYPASLLKGAMLHYSMVFAALTISVLPVALILSVMDYDAGVRLFSWLPFFYLGGLILVLASCMGRLRLELFVCAGFAAFQLVIGRMMIAENGQRGGGVTEASEFFYFLVLLLCCAYSILLAWNTLEPRKRERETVLRLAQAATLVIAVCLRHYFSGEYALDYILWGTPLLLAVSGSLSSLAGTLSQAPRPGKAPKGATGVFAFFLAGYSRGGWLWCFAVTAVASWMLKESGAVPFFRDYPAILLLTTQIVFISYGSANKLFSLVRFNEMEPESLIMTLIFLITLIVSIVNGFIEGLIPELEGVTFLAWWSLNLLLIVLQLPGISRDFIRALTGRFQQA